MLFILNFMLFFLWLQIECSYEKIVICLGSGTNAENIIQYFKKTNTARVIAVLQTTNAGVINRVQNTMCLLKFSPKHNYLKSKYKKIKYNRI
jgi:folate-dependent phosphoribosylglycinamide formyltransferase PurN